MQLLAERISQSLNELALQIDLLYKFVEKDREMFLGKIGTFQACLLQLKSSLKQSNKEYVEKQYKETRVKIIEMKRMMDVKLEQMKNSKANQENNRMQQNRLNMSRQLKRGGSVHGRSHNESLFDEGNTTINENNKKIGVNETSGRVIGVMRHVGKRDYEKLMEDIVEKNDKNKELSQEIDILRRENRQMKQRNGELERKCRQLEKSSGSVQQELKQCKQQLQITQRVLLSKEQALQSFKESSLQRQSQINQLNYKISQLSEQLQLSSQKVYNFSNLEEVASAKTAILQQALNGCKRELAVTQQELARKDLQSEKLLRELKAWEERYEQAQAKRKKQQLQLQNQREDLQVLQDELSKSQKLYYELKISYQALQHNLQLQTQTFKTHQSSLKSQISSFKQIILGKQQAIKLKELEISQLSAQVTQIHQICQVQLEQKSQLQRLILKRQAQAENQRKALVCDIQLKNRQINKLSEQIKKSLQLSKTLQEEINQNHLHRTQLRDNSRLLSNDLKGAQLRHVQLTHAYQQLQLLHSQVITTLNQKQSDLQTAHKTITSLSNQLKQAKIRLHKAKIQAIHDIRNTLL